MTSQSHSLVRQVVWMPRTALSNQMSVALFSQIINDIRFPCCRQVTSNRMLEPLQTTYNQCCDVTHNQYTTDNYMMQFDVRKGW